MSEIEPPVKKKGRRTRMLVFAIPAVRMQGTSTDSRLRHRVTAAEDAARYIEQIDEMFAQTGALHEQMQKDQAVIEHLDTQIDASLERIARRLEGMSVAA